MLFIIKSCHKIKQQIKCKICRLQHSTQLKSGTTERPQKNVEELIKKLDRKILFSSYIEKKYSHLKFTKGRTLSEKLQNLEKNNLNRLRFIQPLPVYLKYTEGEQEDPESSEVNSGHDLIQFPFSVTHTEIASNTDGELEDLSKTQAPSDAAISEVKKREELLKERKRKWMSAYENYPYDLVQEKEDEIDDENSFALNVNYGTPDPESTISNIPCGGCGAFLHCKDASIPGYIPSEIFKSFCTHQIEEIQSIVCQRCYFLKEFNTALQVRVSPDEYPKVLEAIRRRKALVLLLIDLLDFPCSIWPGITDIIGNKKPVMIIGNKVDLLPSDSSSYLNRIMTVLTESVKEKGLETTNVVHTALISALTGWGVEELITKIHNVWGTRGDVYLVGCTNVGKSSLFNLLLQSDFCKVKASDLIHRATTSCWPGTTLNLLKFPILRPTGWRLYVRTKRLQSINRITAMERRLRKDMLKKTRDPKYATLMGHIDKTFSESGVNTKEFSSPEQMGIDETDPEYAMGKWCYDTPGVVRPEQIIHLLTTEELTKTLPKSLIRPYTIRVKQNTTVFIAGLARLDYIKGPDSVLLTIFRSEHLPITVCNTQDAEELYETFVGTELLSVPEGNDQRLRVWPGLKAGDLLAVNGINWNVSCGDIVLSNAGWITVTFGGDLKAEFKPWTPEARGIFLRKSLLPFTVTLRGKKVRRSVAYTSNNIFVG